jgi:hypothetical protein
VKKEPAADPTAAVYGWPSEYLEKRDGGPQLELVARSSSVDAMKFFGAQGSSKDPVETTEQEEPKPLIVFGAPSASHQQGHAPHTHGRVPTPVHVPTPAPGPALLPGISKALLGQHIEADHVREAREARRKQLLTYGAMAGAVVLIAGLGFGAITLFSKIGQQEQEPEKVATGAIMVTSAPAGANVIVDGHDTKLLTPVSVDKLPIDRPVRVQVRMEGFVAMPSEATISITEKARTMNAYFVLKRGRQFRIETTPEGASLEINGRMLSEVTPATLPAVPLGETATVALTLGGYLPHRLVLHAVAETATVATVAMELGREIDIVSEPPGARVFVDGIERGLTPIYDLLVPTSRKFTVKVDKKGYRSWKQRLSAKSMRERLLEADLQQLPLLAMPMTKEELVEAKDWDRKLSKLNSGLRGSKAKLAAVEKKLEQVESQPNIFIGRIADAQRDVDEWRGKVEEFETELAEVEAQIQSFRDRVMAKLEE